MLAKNRANESSPRLKTMSSHHIPKSWTRRLQWGVFAAALAFAPRVWSQYSDDGIPHTASSRSNSVPFPLPPDGPLPPVNPTVSPVPSAPFQLPSPPSLQEQGPLSLGSPALLLPPDMPAVSAPSFVLPEKSQDPVNPVGPIGEYKNPIASGYDSILFRPYWVDEEKQPIKPAGNTITPEERVARVNLEDLIWEAMSHSPYLRGQLLSPRMREQEAEQAWGTFDPNRFVNSIWSDRSDPVGSTLATGGAPRLNETNLQNSFGVKKKNTLGGSMELSQDASFRNNNSVFFQPHDQADTKMLLRYTQPLMRGAGKAYNTSSVRVAQFQVGVAENDARLAMQRHALDITQYYWELYKQRAQMIQTRRALDRLITLKNEIAGRADLDTIRSQLSRAQAAVENLQARLTRSSAAAIQAESNLRAKVNSPSIQYEVADELIPLTEPLRSVVPIDPELERQNALESRPDILAVRDEIKAANVRLKVAENELKPTLNLVSDFYLHGLRGNYNAMDAFGDQFSTGRGSYSAGVEFLRPKAQRAAKAIQNLRSLEMQQLMYKLEDQLLHASSEIQSAIAEVDASFVELKAGQESTLATKDEVEHLSQKWLNSPLLEPAMVSQYLEQLLDAQIRLVQSENTWVDAESRYMVSIARLHFVTGAILSLSPEPSR